MTRQFQRGCNPSIPARANDEHLLHMQQSFAPSYSGLNVRVPEHFHPPPPRLLPQVIGRQNPARQQRIVRHRLQPRLAA